MFHRLLLPSLFFSLAALAHALEIAVPVGGDIQSAANQVASAGGGSVLLAPGTHVLTGTLRIGSNTRLAGAGRESTKLTIDGDFNVIQQAEEGLDNVTIERLTVAGKPSESCYGILIEAYETWHNNITLRDIEVTGAGMGVHLKRARNIVVTNARIHSNGAAGKERYYHNLYLRSCEKIHISDSNLDRGTSGNGLNISYSTDLVVERTTARDNFFRGMRAAESDGFAVIDCVITGNGGTGLIANQEKGNVTKRLDWRGNTVSGNREGGVQARRGATGSVVGNTAINNLKFDYDLPAGIQKTDNN
ncbi:MAG: right-handed parallel beta-helix repeat-containing protein [Opitutaceae bacterium]|jgi:polygalacturonase|nr:right-handed parallel beta-helix repeat-containing protein [Opitutaceae bacterium]